MESKSDPKHKDEAEKVQSKKTKPCSHLKHLIALVLIFLGLATSAGAYLNAIFWTLSPSQKLAHRWTEDLQLLEKSNTLPKQWKNIKEIKISYSNGQAEDLAMKIKPQISKANQGENRLEIFIIHWLEGYRYGVIIQYKLIDIKTNNTVHEFGRTLKLGLVY